MAADPNQGRDGSPSRSHYVCKRPYSDGAWHVSGASSGQYGTGSESHPYLDLDRRLTPLLRTSFRAGAK
jgi:hypothetical protein